MPESVV